jgi:hypothetical protein
VNKSKNNRRLSLNKATVRQLGGNVIARVVGGISGDRNCNFTLRACDATFDTCPDTVSGGANCQTGGWSACGC